MQEQAPEHVHAGIIWTPRMRERLELLSLYRPTPPWVEGNAHSLSHVAPVQHSAVPCLFKYDPEAFIALSTVLHDLLSDDSACSPSWRDVLARRRASESYADPFPVQGEAGLRCDLLLRVLRVMVDKPDREWQRMESPLDCGLRHRTGGFSCHSETKCGYNLRPATGDGHDDDEVNERVVLGSTFFATLIDYLQTVGQIEYSVENGDLVSHPASIREADGGKYPYLFADTSDDMENQKRLLCQIRAQFCRFHLRTSANNPGIRYIALTTFRHACLFTLHRDCITVSDPLSIDGDCTPHHPIGNVASLFYVLSNLQQDQYGIQLDELPNFDRTRSRGAGASGTSSNGGGHGRNPLVSSMKVVKEGASGSTGALQYTAPVPDRSTQPADKDRWDHRSRRAVSTNLDDSTRTSGDNFRKDVSQSQSHSHSQRTTVSPTPLPSTSTFSPEAKNHDAGRCTRTEVALQVDFDLPDNVAGEKINNTSAWKIIDQGVYLSHHCLRTVSLTPDGPSAVLLQGDSLVVRINGYLGIGALSTVFYGTGESRSGSVPWPLAIKYTAPHLFPKTPGYYGGWDRAGALEAIESEDSAINLIVRSGHAEDLIPTWLGTWTGDHSALGKVWCGVMRAGIPVDQLDDDDKAHIIAMCGLLHKIGVIHGDISMANMCRIPLSPLPLPLSSPLSPGEQQQQPVRLIDFGCAVLRPSILRKAHSGDVVDAGAGPMDEYADMDRVWGERASAEMEQVRLLLGKV